MNLPESRLACFVGVQIEPKWKTDRAMARPMSHLTNAKLQRILDGRTDGRSKRRRRRIMAIYTSLIERIESVVVSHNHQCRRGRLGSLMQDKSWKKSWASIGIFYWKQTKAKILSWRRRRRMHHLKIKPRSWNLGDELERFEFIGHTPAKLLLLRPAL